MNTVTFSSPQLESNSEELFKQITSMLGLKIINVSFSYERNEVILYCRRGRSKFTIEINSRNVIVKNSKGTVVSEFYFNMTNASTFEYNYPNPQKYVLPTPNVWEQKEWNSDGYDYSNIHIDSKSELIV